MEHDGHAELEATEASRIKSRTPQWYRTALATTPDKIHTMRHQSRHGGEREERLETVMKATTAQDLQEALKDMAMVLAQDRLKELCNISTRSGTF